MKKPADIDSALTKFYNYDHVLESQVQAKLTFRQQSDTASPEDDVALAFLAAGAGLVDVVRDMVLNRGVDVESAIDQHGLSLLMTAVGHNAELVVAFLLEHALTIGEGTNNDPEAARKLVEFTWSPPGQNDANADADDTDTTAEADADTKAETKENNTHGGDDETKTNAAEAESPVETDSNTETNPTADTALEATDNDGSTAPNTTTNSESDGNSPNDNDATNTPSPDVEAKETSTDTTPASGNDSDHSAMAPAPAPTTTQRSYSVLHFAAAFASAEVVQQLLDTGAQLPAGVTTMAVQENQLDNLEILAGSCAEQGLSMSCSQGFLLPYI